MSPNDLLRDFSESPVTAERLWSKVLSDTSNGCLADSSHTAAQIALDELKDILDALETDLDPLLEKRLVDTARDFERYVHEGLQKFPLNEHLLALEADYHNVADKYALAESALQKAFGANPRQDWVAIRSRRRWRNAASQIRRRTP